MGMILNKNLKIASILLEYLPKNLNEKVGLNTLSKFWAKQYGPNYLEQVLGRTPNWQDREIWFSISNDRWELLTLKYKAQPQDILVFPFLYLVLGF